MSQKSLAAEAGDHAAPLLRALSVEQGARALGIGRTALYELIRSGQLATLRVGRRRLISIKELDRFVTTRTENRR